MRGRAIIRSCTPTTLHGRRKRIAQAGDQLKERQIDVGQLAPGHKSPAAFLEHGLEIAEIFRRAFGQETFGEALGFRFLVLVIKPATDRVMHVVNLLHEVGHGQLQLMQPEPAGLVAGTELQARPR